MVTVKRLKLKNFMSVGNSAIEVFLDNNQTNMISGVNGAAKSSLYVDGVTFALFGKPYRNINKPALVNTINGGKLESEIEFTFKVNHTCIVKRGIKPNYFEIYVDGKLIDPPADAYAYQDYLETQILGMSYRSFTQTVILSKTNYVPFMELKTNIRREFIEDILELKVFTEMNKVLKTKVDLAKSRIKDCETKIEVTNDKLEFVRRSIQKALQNTEEIIISKQLKLDETLELLSHNEETFDQLDEALVELYAEYHSKSEKYNNNKELVDNKVREYTERKKYLLNDLNFFEHTTECSTCRQSLADEHKQIIINSHTEELKKIESNLNLIQEKVVLVDQCKTKLDSIMANINHTKIQLATLNTKITHAVNTSTDLKIEISKLKQEQIEDVEDSEQIQKLQKELKKFQKGKHVQQEQIELYKVANHLLKDTGIKAQVIKQYIPIINQYINKYLDILNFYVQFELDESFNETIKSRGRDTFTYASFSEGEKLRIDLALILTWRAIAKMRNSCSCNLLIMDEIADASMDAEGVDLLFDIFRELVDNDGVSLFVISHRGEQFIDKFDNHIKVQKVKGFSHIEQD